MAKTEKSAGSESSAGFVPSAIAAAALVVGVRHAARHADGHADGDRDDERLATEPPTEEPEGTVARLLWRFDQYQREHAALAFPIAVGKKFGQDKAGKLAALVAYYGFFSVFPLMLAFLSVIGYVVDDPEDQQEFADAAADQIPVVGQQIRETAGQLDGSVVAIVVGVAVALWSGLKIVDAMQNALNTVWDLPRTARPNIAERRLRSLLMLGLIGGGLAGSIAASNVATVVDVIPGGGKVAIWGGSLVVSILLYELAFQLLTDDDLPWRDLWPGAIFSGTCWWALQTFGSVFIINQEQNAGEAYGQFASIIALLAFLFVAAQLSILGAEISVVKSRRLWPRAITEVQLTEADVRSFELLAGATRQNDAYEVTVRPVRRSDRSDT